MRGIHLHGAVGDTDDSGVGAARGSDHYGRGADDLDGDAVGPLVPEVDPDVVIVGAALRGIRQGKGVADRRTGRGQRPLPVHGLRAAVASARVPGGDCHRRSACPRSDRGVDRHLVRVRPIVRSEIGPEAHVADPGLARGRRRACDELHGRREIAGAAEISVVVEHAHDEQVSLRRHSGERPGDNTVAGLQPVARGGARDVRPMAVTVARQERPARGDRGVDVGPRIVRAEREAGGRRMRRIGERLVPDP